MALEYQENDREAAMKALLVTLRTPLLLFSHGDREVCYSLARFHNISAVDLLDYAVKLARRR